MKPSPCPLTIVPPWPPVTFVTTSLWTWSTSSHRRSPRNAFSFNESSMSVNAIVTVPSGADVDDRSGRASFTASTISSSDFVRKNPCSSFGVGTELW
jgi:hypothetical protein